MESPKKKTNLENIKDNLPLISAALASLSVLRLILYYRYFGINIIDYIELTEAFILSMPVFIYFGLGSMIGLLVGLFSIKRLRMTAIDQLNIKNNSSFKERVIEISGGAGYLLFVYLYPIILIIVIVFAFYYHKVESLEWIMTTFITLWLFLFSDVIANEIALKLDGSGIVSTTIKIEFYIKAILAVSFIILGVRSEAYSVVYSKYEHLKHVKIVMEDKIIVTNDTYRFVGKTKSYVFFYDIVKGSADVIPLDGVKSFTIIDSEPHINKSYKESVIPVKGNIVGDSVKQKFEKDTVRSKPIADTAKSIILTNDSVKNVFSTGSKK